MVAFDKMKSKLLTLEQVQARLSSTEPLKTTYISDTDKILFAFEPTWNIGLEEKPGTELVDATMRINGSDHQLTKDAALQVGAEFGLPGKYASKIPSDILEKALHFHYTNLGDKSFNVLTTGKEQSVAALTRPTINPFSNSLLVSEVVQGIVERYGSVDIYADYKFHHSLQRTDIRFIIPEVVRTISDGGMIDVPAGEVDEWSGGIHLTNSLIGKTQTRLETYLFRWWCTNGAITQLEDVGQVYSRRGAHEEQDVYQWAASAIDELLEGFGVQFDLIQSLTSLKLGSNTGEILSEIFDTYNMPVSQRKPVIDELEAAPELNMYVLMNAITRTANDPEISEDRIDKLLRIGGAIPGTTFNGLKARVYAEGQQNPEGPNPYDLRPVVEEIV